MKDVGEYFDHLVELWRVRGVTAEPIGSRKVFEYAQGPGPPFARGHVVANLSFPHHPRAFLSVDEFLVAVSGYIRRQSYAYDLVYDEAVLENWHRHHSLRSGREAASHGSDHQHQGARRVPSPPISHKRALDACLSILWETMRADIES